jgi:peptidoglycan hydrolase CwlO-like protein
MRLKGFSTRELKILESKLKNDIKRAEGTIVTEQQSLKRLRNEIGQVRVRRRQLEYKERLRSEFVNLQVH